ncbi:hypothetical protein [Archangium violaceum]|uniref:Lipoprotein n=1 Tax=Archangium violaceum Cb vi76 TaxID=1406225 RepID=A0A084T2E3_9BACT|nr:hypothetical protein [Archangium violaceum]KFA94878.1 hypothetical protein Q664_00560 [Archangium violaceum Cb vi76]
MKRLALGLTLGTSLLAGCPGPVDPDVADDVSSNITQNTTWTADKVYTLKGYIFVESGTLTIEPGTQVVGEEGSALIITRNAKLNAVGTAARPIVFTSAKPEGERAAGDWGGVVLLGKAKINVAGGTNTVEGFFATSGDERTKYGGDDDAHDCGKLKYARIEFAGFELAEDNELNGLTTGACGSATELDYIQVHKGADDGVEMFGGTANLKHIVISQPDDDGLDYDLGYTGKVQFLVVQQNDRVGNRAIEASGNKTTNTATPRSVPEIWNASFIGSGRAAASTGTKQEGLVFNTGAGIKLNNAIVAHFADKAVDVDGAASAQLSESGNLTIKNTIFWMNKGNTTSIDYSSNPVKDAAGNTTNEDATRLSNDTIYREPDQLLATVNNNRVVDPMLSAAVNAKTPNFKPTAESQALITSNSATPPADGFFDTSAKFIGAVGSTDWTAGWTGYPEN